MNGPHPSTLRPIDPSSLGIQETMRAVAEMVGADRVSAFDYDFEAHSASVTYRWNRPGFGGDGDSYRQVSLASVPDWDLAAHLRGVSIWTPDTSALPRGRLRDMNLKEGIKSTLAVPVMAGGGCVGFVQFNWLRDYHAYSGQEQGLLSLFSSLLQNLARFQRANEAKQESESRLRSVSDNLTSGMIYQVVSDAVGGRRFTFVSDSVRRMHGISPEEALADASTLFDQIHADDLERLRAAEQESARTLDVLKLEVRYTDKAGASRWSSLSSKPRRLDHGVTCWDGVEFDITEHKRSEAAVQESEYLLRESQRAAAIGSYSADLRNGRWTSSEVLDHLLGIGPGFTKDIQGWLGLIHPDDREALARHLDHDVKDLGQPFTRDYRIIRPSDGAVRWLKGAGVVKASADGSLTLIGTIQDITDRKHLDDDRERLLTAVSQAAETIVITDAKGSIEFVNPAFERISGYSTEEALGQNPRVLKSGQHDEAFYREFWDTISQGRTWKGRLVNKRKDGSLYTEEATISPVRGPDGAIAHYVAVKHDITERLRLESQFQQSQKLESVGRLAGGVAHDFNNMLGVILGAAELELAAAQPGTALHANLMEIQGAAQRSAALTRQLLAFARRQPVSPKVLDLNATIQAMLGMLRRLIGEQIDLQWRPQEGLGAVRMDPAQIDQIVVNLCVNARDAIAGVGGLSLETAEAELGEADCVGRDGVAPGRFALLSIRDSGHGMDAATLARAFEPFFTTKGPGQGSGLGLATVYGIVNQNRGMIDVESAPGQGTTFRVYLPIHKGRAEAAPAPTAGPAAEGGDATILLVEDQASLLRMSRLCLERLGYRVLPARDPGEAISLAHDHVGDIQLLLTDVVMPEMNGRDLAKRLQSLYPGLRCLFMSGYTADVIAHQGVINEGIQFLQKPFSLGDLAAKVKEVLAAE